MNIKSNEKKENSAVELVVEVSAAEFEAAIEKVYNKQKKNIMLPGFRKGKAPRKMVEKMYGAEVFYEDAINEVYPEAYEAALKEADLEPVAYPSLRSLRSARTASPSRLWSPSSPRPASRTTRVWLSPSLRSRSALLT